MSSVFSNMFPGPQMPEFKDVSTVFSVAPFEVFDTKPGILPGTYRIPACKDIAKPERLLINTGTHIMPVGGKKHPLRIETPSYQIAKSIVEDCISSQLWCTPGIENPGLCWIQGDISVEELKTKYAIIYESTLSMQRAWFRRICKETDNEWSRYKNHRVVSDTARFASRVLGLDPEWMKTDEAYGFNKCQVCGAMNDVKNLICTGCHVHFDTFYNDMQTSKLSNEEKLKGLVFSK